MTGSLSVRGQVLPVGGVTAKIEAAAESGIRKVLIPLANMRDVVLEEKYIGKIIIVPVSNMSEVLENALIGGIKKESLLKKLAALVENPSPLSGPKRPAVIS
jgi:Lon-like ATP-dependent protease